MDVKTQNVHFYVQKSTGFSTIGAIVPFDVERLNIGGGMNLTSGIFSAPKAGIYIFSFKGTGIHTGGGWTGFSFVSLDRNGESVARGSSRVDGTRGFLTVSLHVTLQLDMGDQISMILSDGQLTDGYTQFMGSLLEENLAF